jgi:hypothetical protein
MCRGLERERERERESERERERDRERERAEGPGRRWEGGRDLRESQRLRERKEGREERRERAGPDPARVVYLCYSRLVYLCVVAALITKSSNNQVHNPALTSAAQT